MAQFKKGSWLIRKWSKSNGNEFDITEVLDKNNTESFIHGIFYRIKGKKIDCLTFEPSDDKVCAYFDTRMSIQWRAMTDKEKIKYFSMIVIHHNDPKVK